MQQQISSTYTIEFRSEAEFEARLHLRHLSLRSEINCSCNCRKSRTNEMMLLDCIEVSNIGIWDFSGIMNKLC